MATNNHPPLRDLDEDAALRSILEGTATETGKDFFAALVKNLSRALNTHGAWVTEYFEASRRLKAIAFWLDGQWVADYEYKIDGTPCAPVIEGTRLVHIPDNVVELFPRDPDLQPMAAVSYMGVPLLNVDGRILGHLAVMDTRPMPEEPRLIALFKIFTTLRKFKPDIVHTHMAKAGYNSRLAVLFYNFFYRNKMIFDFVT